MERQVCHISVMHRDVAVQPDQLVKPTGRVAVFLCEVDGRDTAAELVGEIAGRAPNATHGVEDLVGALDRSKLGELAGRDSAHGVEVFEGCEIGTLHVVEVHAGGHEGFLDAIPGEAGCILSVETHRWLWVLAMEPRRSATSWG